ncbi:hypothetical protein QE152_g27331 [Popillia japonica]|uniref:Uncharacterized protein n=1 Tax=Popillia japonica TaxID=7064 RepID=A0AAW1JV09_POPJA
MDVLNVLKTVKREDLIAKEYHNYRPFGSPKYGNNDEIRIVIPEIDRYTLTCESFLSLEGKLRLVSDETKVSATAKLINNAVAFMFTDIRYVMNVVDTSA